MSPKERKKPPRLQKQSYSLDNPHEDIPEVLCRATSVTLIHDDSVRKATGPAWLRRSRDKLGETPEYLIRTGSMKSKRIDDTDRDTEHATVAVPSNYTSYVVQAGCYMWTGRSYHRDSYIVQRREKRREVIRGDTEGREVTRGDTEGRELTSGDTERREFIKANGDTEGREVSRRDTERRIVIGGDMKPVVDVEKQDIEHKMRCYDKPALPVLKKKLPFDSLDKIRMECGRSKEKCESEKKCSSNKMNCEVVNSDMFNDDIVCTLGNNCHIRQF